MIVVLCSLRDFNTVMVKSGLPWEGAIVNGEAAEPAGGDEEPHLLLTLMANTEVRIQFKLS
ncbi:hypothetical protein D3C85_1900870 [compost metagenome]